MGTRLEVNLCTNCPVPKKITSKGCCPYNYVYSYSTKSIYKLDCVSFAWIYHFCKTDASIDSRYTLFTSLLPRDAQEGPPDVWLSGSVYRRCTNSKCNASEKKMGVRFKECSACKTTTVFKTLYCVRHVFLYSRLTHLLNRVVNVKRQTGLSINYNVKI